MVGPRASADTAPTPDAPRVVALVVTFNRLDQLKKTVARLLESAPLAAVLVVDNASTDGTGDWLATKSNPKLHCLTLARNTGGAGGFEAGMRHIIEKLEADWLLLMDDDGRPVPGAITQFASRPRTSHGAWVCAVHFPDGGICEMNRPLFNPFRHLGTLLRSVFAGRDGYHISDDCYGAESPMDVDGGSFVGLFVSREAVERVGYPDGSLFIYGDDALYCLAMRKAGIPIAFDPSLKFEHDCGSEMGVHPIRPLWKVYYMYRNLLIVYRFAAGPLLFWPVLLVKTLSWRRKARHYGDARATYLDLMTRAIRDGVARRSTVSFDQVRAWADPHA